MLKTEIKKQTKTIVPALKPRGREIINPGQQGTTVEALVRCVSLYGKRNQERFLEMSRLSLTLIWIRGCARDVKPGSVGH